MRLSIEVTLEQHQQFKAVAALSGKSMKAYILYLSGTTFVQGK